MAISEGKERRMITLTSEQWKYLEEQAELERQERSGRITSSTLLSDLVTNDMTIKKAFGRSSHV